VNRRRAVFFVSLSRSLPRGYGIGNQTGFSGCFFDFFVSLPLWVKERPDLWVKERPDLWDRTGFETCFTLQNARFLIRLQVREWFLARWMPQKPNDRVM
jgi:hypothetical protein